MPTSSGTHPPPPSPPSHDPSTSNTPHQPTTHRRPNTHHPTHRTPLSLLHTDEEYILHRKHNIQNYGSYWLKPPGIPKSLYQLREEKRELEEHNEALRREALAQELAEAEAAEGEGLDGMLQGEGMDGEDGEEGEGGRDLDDEVPEAEELSDGDEDSGSASGSENENGDEGEGEDEDEDTENSRNGVLPRNILTSRVPDEFFRDALSRGPPPQLEFNASALGIDEEEEDGDGSQILQEDDLVRADGQERMQMDMDMDMEADLDADIPEASDGEEGYEHTDTEAELSSSEEESDGYDGGGGRGLGQRGNVLASSMVRSDGTQNSLDLSGMGSSPQLGLGRRRG